MPLNNVTFVLGQGGLGRPLPGQDYISGLLFFTGTLPSGFSSTDRAKQVFSLSDAESLGIKEDHADATPATSTNTVTAIGADGSTVTVRVPGLNGSTVTLGTYTKTSAETDADDVAAAIALMINNGTFNHGYSATADGAPLGELIITAPKKMGIFLNTKLPTFEEVPSNSAFAITVAAFTGGVASKQAVWHYHISEFFRVQPQGVLWLGFYAIPVAYDYTEVTALQAAANGTIRQVGVYKDGAALAANGADLLALHAVCATNVGLHKELIGILGADISGVANLSTLYDNRQIVANLASICISQDGGALGASLFQTTGKSITTLGAMLGAISLSKVSESIAWVQRFNISDGVENDVIAFANGQLWTNLTASNENLATQLQDYRYVFLRKFIGVAGSYFNEESSAVNVTSDYAYIAGNRTIQKATRGVYSALVPALNSPIVLNANGTLTDTTIAYFETLAEGPLNQMIRDGELSAMQVAVNPSQNVLQTGKLVITATLVPVGVARNIQVNIGFNVSIN